MIQSIQGTEAGGSAKALAATRTQLLAKVPPFRPVALKLMKMAGAASQSFSQIVDILKTDAVLTVEVLRLANSPLVGARYEIKSILQGLAFLGLDRINALIMTMALKGLADNRHSSFTKHCWRHNLATALTCERLSAKADLPTEKCYVAGLVHDIGHLALLRAFPSYPEEVVAGLAEGRNPLDIERELFGFDHGEAGRWLLAHWGCPIELQNVAAMHENPSSDPTTDGELVALVRAASQVVELMGISTFPVECSLELADIAAPLSADVRNELLSKYPEIADSVGIKVNEIELSLV